MGWADTFTLVMVALGALFFFTGWVGLMRFPDPLSRLHALSKADNLGLGLVVIGLMPHAGSPFAMLKLLALWLLVLLAGGVTGQMLAGAIHRHGGAVGAGPAAEHPAAGADGGTYGGGGG